MRSSTYNRRRAASKLQACVYGCRSVLCAYLSYVLARPVLNSIWVRTVHSIQRHLQSDTHTRTHTEHAVVGVRICTRKIREGTTDDGERPALLCT